MSTPPIDYDPPLESAVAQLAGELQGSYPLSPRSIAALLLAGDEEITALMASREGSRADRIGGLLPGLRAQLGSPVAVGLAQIRRSASQRMLDGVILQDSPQHENSSDRWSQALINPWTGVPLLLLALGMLYLVVGVLGAQVFVGWLEAVAFERYLTPWATELTLAAIPWPSIQELLIGPYGIVTLALRYAFAIILPIVGTFFLVFAVIEDSGYLPRLALLIDRVFKPLGLNGRAVIPMVLGFGCDTMATVVTRTLETRRERIIATMLLALAIPCSAQLGVVLGILAGHPGALLVWVGSVLGILVLVGFLAARLLPGERPSFYMEIPPLRRPLLGSVVLKTATRMEWYLREVLPVFVMVSVGLWLADQLGAIDFGAGVLRPVVRALGLPDQTAMAFLLGFFRRDYGAAGLYDLRDVMNGSQRAVSAVTLTLFVPCLAQFGVMLHERGWKTAVAILVFIIPFAFLVGWLLSQGLAFLGVTL